MVEESLLVNHDRSLMDTNFCYDTKQVATVASVHNMLEKLLLKLKLESKSSVTLHSLFESDRKEDSHHKWLSITAYIKVNNFLLFKIIF